MTHLDDLIYPISDGDERAFETLMKLISNELLFFALSIVKNKEIAEDIVSESFVRIWQRRATLPEISNFKSYLFVSVKNGALMHLRSNKNIETIMIDDYVIDRLEGNDDETLIDRDDINQINRAIESLPEKCKLVFYLAKMHGFKHREIAKMMNMSAKTVNNHIVYALKKISQFLDVEKH